MYLCTTKLKKIIKIVQFDTSNANFSEYYSKSMHKIILFVVLFVTISAFAGCHEDTKTNVNGDIDLSSIPEMTTTDVSMLVSDSGVIRYLTTAPIWYRYNLDPSNRYWYFPEGLQLDQLDNEKNSCAHIQADTAYNYETKKLWHLIKNVRISNIKGEKFLTNDLYWDLRNKQVYSDSFIHIERNNDIIEGYGFKSNDSFTEYEIRQTTGIFEMKNVEKQNDEEYIEEPDNESNE